MPCSFSFNVSCNLLQAEKQTQSIDISALLNTGFLVLEHPSYSKFGDISVCLMYIHNLHLITIVCTNSFVFKNFHFLLIE